MFKIVGLGGVLILMFLCCCSMGTFLSDSLLGENTLGPVSPNDMFGGSPGEEGGSGFQFLGNKLPIPGLGETEIDVSQFGDLVDVPAYPGAMPAAEKVKVPAAAGLIIGQLQKELSEEGVSFAIYTTSDSIDAVTDWYKAEMARTGWEVDPSIEDFMEGGFVVFTQKADETVVLLYAFSDTETGNTLILLMRGDEGAN